jgi:xanthine dehydrogenase accessory factor
VIKVTEKKKIVIVRGGGDLATGVIYRLWRSCYDVLCLEKPNPLVIRRSVAAAQAVFDGSCRIEDMEAVLINSLEELDFTKGINVLTDPEGYSILSLKPFAVVDAIMAKRNIGTCKGMAGLVLALGPGFAAPEDVHGVIETKRGHSLGRLITNGNAERDSGIPGAQGGYAGERLLRSPADGYLDPLRSIGDSVNIGDIVGSVDGVPVKARLSGVIRGLIHPSVLLTKGVKIGDIDARNDPIHCFSISDKALAVAGGVLEAFLRFEAIGRLY